MQRANRKAPRFRQCGFTLLELLIASIIFAIMAIMAYGGLDNVIANSKSSQQALKRLQQVQQSISVLNRDFTQIIPRAIRDEFGNIQPYISAGSKVDTLVEFTRGGRVNPANLLRSTLLRVAYQFEDDKLIRLQWPQLDRAQELEPRKTTLIDNVEEVSIRYLDRNKQWQDQWPPLNAVGGGTGLNATTLNGIEIVMTLKDWGEIRRLYAMN
ncbi:MAG TPA: type II secretion system protein GspJ [Gammaproteobacteria bacterium]|nr:type II secretion system protein GspJ [Gammaproteobacteria bacterium]